MIILTLAGAHLPGGYTYRTEDQRLIGRIFTPTTRADYWDELAQFQRDLGSAPLETGYYTDLSEQSRRFIDTQ